MNFNDITTFDSNSVYRLGDLMFRRADWHQIAVSIKSQKKYYNSLLYRYLDQTHAFLKSNINFRTIDKTHGMVDLNILIDIIKDETVTIEPNTLYINIRAGDVVDLKETRNQHFIHKPATLYNLALQAIKHNKNINKIKIVTALHYGDKPTNNKKFRYQFTDTSRKQNISKIARIVSFLSDLTKLPIEINQPTGCDFEIIDSDFITLVKNKNVILEPIGGFASLVEICRNVLHNNAEVLDLHFPKLNNKEYGTFESKYNKNPYRLGFFAWCSVHLFNIIKHVEKCRTVPNVKMNGFNLYTSQNDTSRWFKQSNKNILIDTNTTNTKNIVLSAKTKYCNNDYNITTNFINRWFKPSDEVIDRKKYFITQYDIKPSDTLCLYYRGTDTNNRGIDTTYFNVYIENVLSYIHEFGHEVKAILLQSDDQMFVDFVQSQDIPLPIKIIKEIPSTYSNSGFHFEHKDNQTILANNAVDMLAVVNIMAQCKSVFCTTSNVSKWVCLYRGNTSNVFQFRHNTMVI